MFRKNICEPLEIFLFNNLDVRFIFHYMTIGMMQIIGYKRQ